MYCRKLGAFGGGGASSDGGLSLANGSVIVEGMTLGMGSVVMPWGGLQRRVFKSGQRNFNQWGRRGSKEVAWLEVGGLVWCLQETKIVVSGRMLSQGSMLIDHVVPGDR